MSNRNRFVLDLVTEDPITEADITKILADLELIPAAITSQTPDVRIIRNGYPHHTSHHVHVSTRDEMCRTCINLNAADTLR